MTDSTIVLITGANSGIGYATTKLLASYPNYHIIMGCRDVRKGEQALKEIQQSLLPQSTLSVLELDVTNDASIATATETVESQHGRIDAFISNAGTTAQSSTGRAKYQAIFETNVFGAVLASEAFIPLLRKSPRSTYLIQVSSALGSVGLAADSESPLYNVPWDLYRMSKAALDMATIQMHKRLKEEDSNVRVFAFCPGLVRSRLRGESEEQISAQGTAGDPMDSARALLRVLRGERDADVGGFVHANGTWPW
ncbi:hypothetical protein NUU61_005361 [Penicillium alfredii]|uniref:Uncharacterized protein n=1 Tax=Penicillium alfredii TaxID=1506179 RepID=A0A9W9F988_9EURO|nr:uncharacterized protein NUU61_005361 [Penicillium alfredii]KAJ5096005.1 hypothetical protein NUU61_005361 [Penicillium alfredii]